MPAQVFISCGQRTEQEHAIADELKRALVTDGFLAYVAIQAQSIEDVNSGILRQLERSDYYIFIDFRRDLLSAGTDRYRGSLFTHQELAIAFHSGFERVLFFQEEGTELEGLLKYMGSNAVPFKAGDSLVDLVRDAFRVRGWRPDYSRHLIATRLRTEGQFLIKTPRVAGRFTYIDIDNRRPDTAAYDTIARLEYVTDQNGVRAVSRDRGPLKVTGQGAFRQTIWPQSHGAFDLLAIGAQPPHGLYLHTALDLPRIEPLLTEPGRYRLEYAVIAREFPLLRFSVDVELSGTLDTTTITLVPSHG